MKTIATIKKRQPTNLLKKMGKQIALILLFSFTSLTTYAQCAAAFNATDNGNGNFSFTNTSTGYNSPANYFWNFGDGNYSSLENPNHTYASNGTYFVSFGISDSLCQDSIWQQISVTNTTTCNGLASFNATDNGNGNFSFTNTSTGYNSPANYFWNFGDGNYSSLENPNHTYASNGTYFVSFGISDSLCQDSIWQQISVTNTSTCNANAQFTYQNNGNGNLNFTNNSTGNNLAYLWNFGDGTTSTQANPSHTYLADGTYAISLFGYNTTDSTCFDYHVVTTQVTGTINSTQCNAAFIMFPDSFTNIFVLNTSTGNNLSYFWDFGDGNTSTQAYPSYTYSTPGPFYLCLTVSDSINSCTSTYCDSIGSNGVVLRQTGFTINVQPPNVVGIKEHKDEVSELTIYPNPFKETLFIDININDETNVEVFVTDLVGNTVGIISNKFMNAGSHKLQWNAENLSNGIYLLNVKTNNALNVKKLVLNK